MKFANLNQTNKPNPDCLFIYGNIQDVNGTKHTPCYVLYKRFLHHWMKKLYNFFVMR